MELELRPQLVIKRIYTHIEIHSPEGGAVLESVWVRAKAGTTEALLLPERITRLAGQVEETDDGFLTETTQLAWSGDTYWWGGGGRNTSWTAVPKSRASEQTLRLPCWQLHLLQDWAVTPGLLLLSSFKPRRRNHLVKGAGRDRGRWWVRPLRIKVMRSGLLRFQKT